MVKKFMSEELHLRDPENHDSQRRDKDLRIFLHTQINHFPTFGGDFPTKQDRKPGEKKKVHLRHFKQSSGDGAPKLQISVPCRGRTCPDVLALGCATMVRNEPLPLFDKLFTYLGGRESGLSSALTNLQEKAHS